MNQFNSYVYFAFKGDNFDPNVITDELEVEPNDSWRTGEQGRYKQQKYSSWELTSTSVKLLDIDKLVNEVVAQLTDKIERINELKDRLSLDTVLKIVMYVDINEEQSTPFIGHDLGSD